jgi:diguanylate cyclase (GGDEF)-like protein/PAS domain S-box-containing protein
VQVIDTLFQDHDLRLVALAALVCALSTFAGMSLLNHARRSQGAMRRVWLAVAAVSVGFGIWTTHFVAMLAYSPGFAIGYNLSVTLLSLLVAIGIVGTGLSYAAYGNRRSDMALAGALVGLGIGSMHYVGMAAVIVGGGINWNASLVASSVLVGSALGGIALLLGTAENTWAARVKGATFLTLGIVSMHFTGMGAVGLENCYPIVSDADTTPKEMAYFAAGGSILILLFAFGGLYLDVRERRRAELEGDRMRGLADAAVEGLLVCRDRVIVTANASFLRLVGLTESQVTGQNLTRFLDAQALDALLKHPTAALETDLSTASGVLIPAEIIQREVDFGGTQHQAFAVRDLSARKSAEQHIRFLAHHDALTGLANRASFSRALEEEIVRATHDHLSFAVICIDLDRFKEVNDLFGHAVGDALLQRVGTALAETVEGRGRAARLGGDEFVVLISDARTPEQAGRMAEDIADAFRVANEDAVSGPPIAASMGIALFPDNADDAQHLMLHADTALYRAKQDGRGIYRFYSNEMGTEVRDRRMLEHDLRHALSRNQLSLVYQPQIEIDSGNVTGFEALIRWHHPERGEIPPAIFIPVAEESGLILQIGEWVLRTAAAEAARWTAPLSIAVNVSAIQIHAPNFAHLVHEVLVQTGLSPHRLEVEITETALVRDMERAIATLRQIRALGVRIAMDDFGTGYSSLANLRAFPFSKIKVDQSFIKSVDSNSQSAAIVRAVLGLGSGLGVPVIAEGVERREELEFLRNEVCMGAQGYLISRPADISSFGEVTAGRETRIVDNVTVLLKAVG